MNTTPEIVYEDNLQRRGTRMTKGNKPEYMSFPREEITTVSGNKINLVIVPEGDQWGKLMGMDEITAYLQIGPSARGDVPANSVIIWQEMFYLDDYTSRLFELMVTMDFYIMNNMEGYRIHRTRENFKDEFMADYRKLWQEKRGNDDKGFHRDRSVV